MKMTKNIIKLGQMPWGNPFDSTQDCGSKGDGSLELSKMKREMPRVQTSALFRFFVLTGIRRFISVSAVNEEMTSTISRSQIRFHGPSPHVSMSDISE